jgi:hypothetical protein
VKFNNHSAGSHKSDSWIYEIDKVNRITLRYWTSEFENIEEPISNPPSVTTPQERSDLQNLLTTHVLALKNRIDAL